MSEALTETTFELGNGVRLTYPSGYVVEALSILLHLLDSSTDPPSKVSIQHEYRQIIDGKTSSTSKEAGSSLA